MKRRIWSLMAALAVAVAARGEGDLLPPMNGQPSDFAPRRAGAEVQARIKITVAGEGLHRVDRADLLAAGAEPADLLGESLRVYCRTQEVAVWVSQEGLWTDSDYLVFFAERYDGNVSGLNVYWLGWGGTGRRMAERSVPVLRDAPERKSCSWTVRAQGYTFLQDKFLREDGSFDHWFLAISQEGRDTPLVLNTPDVAPGGPASLRAVVYGHSQSEAVNPDHRTQISLNGVGVADFTFDGQVAVTGEWVVARGALGARNAVTFRQRPPKPLTSDRVFARELSLTYTRRLRLAGGRLIFEGASAPRNYVVGAADLADPAWVADVTDPAAPVLLTGHEAGAGDTLRFGDAPAAPARYAVSLASRLRRPTSVRGVAFQGWADAARAADHLVIAPAGFLAQAQRLADRRTAQGVASLVMPLEDLYNEFGYGVADEEAIRQAIGYAYHHWQGPPRYVVLAGNGTYDPRGYLAGTRGAAAYGREERIPLHMGPNRSGWTSLDGWFAQVDGADKRPDLALGRLPATTAWELGGMIDKIMAFESLPRWNWRRREVLLVADWADLSLNGRAISESLRKSILFPSGMVCTTGYTDDLGEAAVRGITGRAFTSGVTYVSYLGHGAMNLWGHSIFDADAAAALRNTHYPIVTMMACRNGALQNPLDGPCMTEALMRNRMGGASACVASTALSFGPGCNAFIHGFMQAMTRTRLERLGEGFLAGLEDLNDYNPHTDELLYINLFGDPAMVVNPP